MLTKRVIPCLDVKNDRVVKGVQFNNLRDCGNPVERALLYQQQGADEIVILDVAATVEARRARRETVRNARAALSIPLTVGGGVASVAAARELLNAGADKVSINTAAVTRPDLIDELARNFGSQCTVVAIDAIKAGARWVVTSHSGTTRTELGAIRWARTVVKRGAGEILLTSWDRDGSKEGYDLELIAAITRAVNVPVIASGGAATPADMVQALVAGADAVLAASMFHDDVYTVAAVKHDLQTSGCEVRL